jgi:hypothetical protein
MPASIAGVTRRFGKIQEQIAIFDFKPEPD